MPRIIVAVSGMPASRKSLFAQKLANLGYEHVILSSILRRRIKEEDEPNLSQAYWEESIRIRQESGEDILAKIAWDELEKTNTQRAVIDGIRCLPELVFLEQKADIFYLVAIQAPPSARHKRLMSWPDGYYAGNLDRIAELEARELKLGMGSVIALCDKIVFVSEMSSATLDDYFEEKAIEINETVIRLEEVNGADAKLQRHTYFSLLEHLMEKNK